MSATRFSHDIVSFELQINSNIYKFEYDLASNLGREDSLHPYLVGSDALACMLEVVLSGKANYILNQKYSTFATQVSEIVKRQLYGSTAVVGAGIYGTTAALGMAYSGFTVDIFDSNEDLFCQVRLVLISTESTAAIIIPDHLTLSFRVSVMKLVLKNYLVNRLSLIPSNSMPCLRSIV